MDDLDLYKLWFIALRIPSKEKISLLELGVRPYALYNMSETDLLNLGLNINCIDIIAKSKNLDESKRLLKYHHENNISVVTYNEEFYPQKLKNIYDPPVALFYKGQLPGLKPSLAIVGSRKASDYGLTVAYKFAYELSSLGIQIISGLAQGIDTAAHTGAVGADGITIGIMGSGFKNIYPRNNRNLIEKIIKKGCVITEFMADEAPLACNFPRRNRIISGLSDFVLVVEAGERSGSLITAHLALEQGKDVFAIPGNIFNYNSTGTNNLIKDGAKLVTKIEDILEEFGISLQNKVFIGYNELEISIINILKTGGLTIDKIVETLNFSTDEILATISKLECMGVIKRTFGNYAILNRL